MFVQDGFLYLIVTKHKLTVWSKVARQHAQSKQTERNHTRKTYQNSSSQTFYFSVQCFRKCKANFYNSISVYLSS